jgi:hypothetical protein
VCARVQVLEAFVESRLKAVESVVVSDVTDDPLPNAEAEQVSTCAVCMCVRASCSHSHASRQLSELDALPALGRLVYTKTANSLSRQLGEC